MKIKEVVRASIIVGCVQMNLRSNFIIFILRFQGLSYRRQKMLDHIRYARQLYNLMKKQS